MASPFVNARLDRIGAEELGSIVALLEAMDRELADTGLKGRRGTDRTGLLKLRVQTSRRLGEWLAAFGMTPRSRAELLNDVMSGTVAADLARRRRESDPDV
jgi:hypothetical protein